MPETLSGAGGQCYIDPILDSPARHAMDFNQEFDQHGAWRRQFAQRLKQLSEWLSEHELMDAGVLARLDQLQSQVKAEKVMVAFVA